MKPWLRRALGVLALGGSFLGFAIGLEHILGSNPLLTKVAILPFIGLYAWGIWCGIALIEGVPGALRLNRFFWALQIPLISSPIVSYMFASGALLNISFEPALGKINFYVRFGSQYGGSVLNAEQPWGIGINVVALGVFMCLTWCIKHQGQGSRETINAVVEANPR